MSNKPPKRVIYPDRNSWLSDILIGFFKTFKNEVGLSLWDALGEYVSFHNPKCAYQGSLWEGEVFLYPKLDYDYQQRKATLKRLFLVSPHARSILAHDYLKIEGYSKNQTPFANLLKKCTNTPNEEYPHLEFMVMNNNVEPSLAKELLLRTAYERRLEQKKYVLENEAMGIEYKNIDVARIIFDISVLEDTKFFNAKRYASFKELLPENLVVDLSWKIGYDLPDIPKSLKKQQLLDVTASSN